MEKRIKKLFSKKIVFTEIDKKILTGLDCSYFSGESKEYLEKVKEQTQLAMNNRKYSYSNNNNRQKK